MTMTASTTSPTTLPAAGTARFTAATAMVLARVIEVLRSWQHRRMLGTLAGLDDRMLRDIGLTRSDLRDAASEPLWRDPTVVLSLRARERRRYRRTGPGPELVEAAPPLAPEGEQEIDAWSSRQFPARSRYY